MTRTPLLASAAFLAGCADGPYAAPSWAVIDVGDDITLAASTSFVDADNEGTLVAAQVMVLDGRTDAAMNDIEVEVTSEWSGVIVLPEDAVLVVEEPDAGSLGYDPDPAEVEAACDAGSGTDAWCAWTWDTGSGTWYTFGEAGATSLLAGTDGRGVLGFTLFVNTLPLLAGGGKGETAYSAATIRASIQVDSDSFAILAE
jgi:hypothetical protein